MAALVDLQISEVEKDKLAKLAMSVEINDKKQFSVNKNLVSISGLLEHALSSRNPVVMRSLREFALVMSPDTAMFFRVLGVDVDKLKARSFIYEDDKSRAMDTHVGSISGTRKSRSKSMINRLLRLANVEV